MKKQPPAVHELMAHDAFVRALARSLLSDANLADDAVQETYAAALTSPPDRIGSLRAWLGTVVRNAARMIMRGESRRSGREHAVARGERVPSTAEAAMRLELQRFVVEAVGSLDEPYRDVIVLRFFEDLSPTEIARARGIPVETVRTRLRRALATLRGRLDAKHGGDRRSWTLALLPLTLVRPAATAAVLGGVLAMSAKMTAVLAVLIVVGAWLAITTLSPDPAPPSPFGADAARSGSAEEPADIETTASPGSVRTGAVFGLVTRNGKPVSARVAAVALRKVDHRGLHRGNLRGMRARVTAAADEGLFESPGRGGAALADGSAGADGRYRLTGLPPGGYRIEAVAADGARGVSIIDLREPGAEAAVDLRIAGGALTFTGRAVWVDGKPFVGFVAATQGGDAAAAPGGDTRPRCFLPTDENGRFSISGLHPGLIGLSFAIPDRFMAESLPVRIPRDEGGEFVVDEALRRVRGRVVCARSGEPVPNAVLNAWSWWGRYRTVHGRDRTGPDGRFEVLLEPGTRRLGVRAPGYVSRQWPLPHRNDESVIRLTPSPSIDGTVVTDADGAPVPGIAVHTLTLKRREASTGRHVVTDADGRFAFSEAASDPVMVFALGGGFVSQGLSDVRANGANPLAFSTGEGETVSLDLRVIPAASVRGQVLDANGTPARGVTVAALLDLPYDENWWPYVSAAGARGVTDESGSFTIATLIPDVPYRFRALPPRGPIGEAGPVAGASGECLDLSIRLPAHRRLVVDVTEAGTGDPVAGALVRVVVKSRGSCDEHQGPWVTSADGRVVILAAPAEPLGVWLTHRDYACSGGIEPISVPGSEDPEADCALSITLARGLDVSGRVLRHDGTPLTEGTVSAHWRGARSAGPTYKSRTFAPVDVLDGSFRISCLPKGSYSLRVTKPDGSYHDHPGTIEAGTVDVSIELAESASPPPVEGSLTCRVLDDRGRPVPNGTVLFHLYAKEPFVHATTHQGWVRAGVGRTSGPATSGHRWIEVLPTVGEDGRRLAGVLAGPFSIENVNPIVRLAPGVTVTGVVVMPDGSGARGARVTAMPIKPASEMNVSIRTVHVEVFTDVGGRFVMGALAPIAYHIEVVPPLGFQAPPPLMAVGGQDGLRFELTAGIAPMLTLLDPDGRPVPGVVALVRPAGPDHGGRAVDMHPSRTGLAGRLRLPTLDPHAIHHLELTPPKDRLDLQPLVIEEWRATSVTLTFAEGFAIRGRVVDDSGQAVPKCRLMARIGDERRHRYFQVGDDGSFEIGHLPPGPVWLRVDSRRCRPVTVPAGTSDVRLVVETTLSLTVRIEDCPADAFGLMYLWDEDRELTRHPDPVSVRGKGEVRLEGLIPGKRYTLWYRRDELRCVFESGIPANRGEVKVRLRPGGIIQGRLTLPEGAERVAISAQNGWWSGGGTIQPDGAFEIRGLPFQRLRIYAWAEVGERRFRARAEAEPGATVVLTLEEVESVE
jgi:RNA polymerase sigma factor (sigma-70 family)